MLNKPPNLPVKVSLIDALLIYAFLHAINNILLPFELLMHYVKQGPMAIHNSMDALAAAALSYDYDEGPKLVSCSL